MTDRELRQLGALLHDIGKFAFRARPLEPGGTHENYGEQFIRTVLANVNALRQHISQIATEAHRVSSAIREADITAAGERQDDPSNYARRLLVAITSRVQLMLDSTTEKAALPEGTWYIEPLPLELEAPMPQRVPIPPDQWRPDETQTISLHEQSWNRFCAELSSFAAISDSWAAIETLYSLLEKYTSTVTSAAYYSLPDITLFDHARVTAALAHCIAEGEKGSECLLVVGDLSGIQRFLYHNLGHAEQRTKLLRGRSLMVRLVADTVVSYLLETFGFYRSNVLYSGGGTFEILLPNSPTIQEALPTVSTAIAQLFRDTLGFALQISMATLPCSAGELINNYAQVRQRLGIALQQAKRQRFRSTLADIFSFEGNPDTLSQLDRYCKQLGEAAPTKRALLELRGMDTTLLPPSLQQTAIVFPSVKIGWALIEPEQLRSLLSGPLPAERLLVHILNSTDLDSWSDAIAAARQPTAASFRFIGNYVPRRANGTIRSFSELAEEGSPNYPLLAFARMDVDWLGMVMQHGLREQNPGERRYTISRVASLSRAVEHFFSGSINRIAEQHTVYLAYAGGDDLFAIGAWTNVLNFVRTVRRQFDQFVCMNKNLTISAGIAITKPNYPIDRAAEEAGRLQELAKEGWAPAPRTEDPSVLLQKDRVALLDCVVEWHTLDRLLAFGENLYQIVHAGVQRTHSALPRSLVHQLLEVTQSIFIRHSGGLRITQSARLAKAIAHIRYSLARRGITANTQEDWLHTVQGELVKLLLDVSPHDRPNNWWNFRIPATYVLWKTRTTT